MRGHRLYPIATLLAFCSFFSSSAQSNYPSTLLWRITGKHLKKPCYLYGTMHLRDKRLFNFGDSLYQSLENTEGLAIEIDFKEYMDSMFLKGITRAQDEKLAKERVHIDQKLDKSSDSLFKALGLDQKNLTKKELKKLRDYRINKFLQQGEMQTIVDGYLVGLALRQKKWVGGIEDVADQLNLVDEIGGELTVDKVLQKETDLRASIEQMIKMYTDQDLTGINKTINSYDSRTKNALLIRRNIKMARRMDSLSAIRTMFFAVGAAHLPGDSGVINLLRKNGFTVEPVFSSQKIVAEEYIKKLAAIPWYTVTDDAGLYTVDMPGNPSQFDEFGSAMNMRMFFDITTMTFYMTSQTIGKFNSTKEFNEAIKKMATRMGASPKQLSIKTILKKDTEGRETSFEKESLGFRVQLLQRDNSLFVLIAGSVNAKRLSSGDVDRFFESFATHKVAKNNKDWVQFTVPGKAVSIRLPGKPKKNLIVDKSLEESSWTGTTYDYSDTEQGLYYMFQARDVKEGFYLTGDSAYFDSYIKDTKVKMDTLLATRQTTFKGFPAFHVDAINEGYLFKLMQVIRGNRVYLLMVGGKNDSLPQANTYFNSLAFDETPSTGWRIQSSQGFSSFAPAKFNRVAMEDTSDKRERFFSWDPNKATSYQVIKEAMSPFYWVKDEASFFSQREQSIEITDSVLKKEVVYNGKLKALDLLIKRQDLNNYKKVRYIISGDTLYTLLSFIPRQYINETNSQRFFSDFTIQKSVPPTIYISKANQLLAALKTQDSLQFETAFDAFNSIRFSKDDLSFLHKALLELYASEEKRSSIQYKIRNLLKEFGDSSTVQFIAANYSKLNPEKEDLKYPLLSVLAEQKTSYSYKILKDLLKQALPAKGDHYSLAYALTDSLQLTNSIYTELLPLIGDSVFSDVMANVSWRLLDSGLIKLEQLQPFKSKWLSQVNAKFANAVATQTEDEWDYYNWIKLLERFKDDASNGLLQKIASGASLDAKYYAVIALFKNDQPVALKAIDELAASNNYRLYLFNQLKNAGKLKLFPSKYYNQKSIAAAELFSLVSEDYAPSGIECIGERTELFKGKKKKFLLFKVHYAAEEGNEEVYLGITGPYNNLKEITTETEAAGLSQELFKAKEVNKQLKDYLKTVETYDNSQD